MSAVAFLSVNYAKMCSIELLVVLTKMLYKAWGCLRIAEQFDFFVNNSGECNTQLFILIIVIAVIVTCCSGTSALFSNDIIMH